MTAQEKLNLIRQAAELISTDEIRNDWLSIGHQEAQIDCFLFTALTHDKKPELSFSPAGIHAKYTYTDGKGFTICALYNK